MNTPNRNFGLAFVINNRSGEPVTIVGLSSKDESEKRFARLVGASATAYVSIDGYVTHVLRLTSASARRLMGHCRHSPQSRFPPISRQAFSFISAGYRASMRRCRRTRARTGRSS